MNASLMAIVDDEKVAPLMEAFREMDAATKMQGSRAFVWNIVQKHEFSRVPVLWIFPGSGVRFGFPGVSGYAGRMRRDFPERSGSFPRLSSPVLQAACGLGTW